MNTAIIISAVLAIFLERKDIWKGFILSWGTVLFFLFMFFAVIVFKNTWISQHAWIFSNGTLAFITWFSILIGKPFTIQYAREQVPKDKWNHPVFIRINYILSSVWGIIFLTGIGLHVLYAYFPIVKPGVYEAISYLPSIFGAWFTVKFPEWYTQKK